MLAHLVRVEYVKGGLGSRPHPFPLFLLGIFFPYKKVESVVFLIGAFAFDCQSNGVLESVARLLTNDRDSIRFIEACIPSDLTLPLPFAA